MLEESRARDEGALSSGSFLSAADASPGGWRLLLDEARRLKQEWVSARRHPRQPLAGRTVGLLFERPSLRTRVSSELAVSQLGGLPVYLTAADLGLGERETVADVARTLARWVDAIVARTVRDVVLREVAAAAGIPVVNALTDREHPCQALADMLTIAEAFGDPAGRTVVFVGDGNNVATSLAIAGASLGARVRLVTPPGHEPPDELLAVARERAVLSGGSVELAHEPLDCVGDADVIYTDVWVSLGQEWDRERRARVFARFQVNDELLAAAPAGARVMHCLPARRGEEITSEVLDGPSSLAFEQAENRLPAGKAVLVALLAS
jgi:ornithine carbamoyltransferase